VTDDVSQLRAWAQKNRATLPYLLACLGLLVVGLVATAFVLAGGPAGFLLLLIILVAIPAAWVLLRLAHGIVARIRRR
jgi:hypothetical protein